MAVRIQKPAVNIREKLAELERPIGVNGAALMATNTPQDAFDILQCGRKNLVINGDMQIWQRGTSVNVGIDQFVRCVDRFWIYCPSGSGNFQRSTDAPTGFIYSLHNNSTAVGSIGTNVELAVQGSSYPFTIGEWITLSFYVKSTSYNTSTVSFSYRDTAEGSGSLPIGASFNRSFYYTTEWRKVSISIQIDALPSGNNRMLQFEFGLPAGAKVTGLQLEKGKVATPFEYRSIGEELALCQRYYEKSFDINTTPSDGATGDSRKGVGVVFNSTDLNTQFFTFAVTKRTSPSITFFRPNFINGTGVWAVYQNGNNWADRPLTAAWVNEHGFIGSGSVTSGTSAQALIISGNWSASAEL